MVKTLTTLNRSQRAVAKVLPTYALFRLAVIGPLLEMQMEVLRAKLAQESEKGK